MQDARTTDRKTAGKTPLRYALTAALAAWTAAGAFAEPANRPVAPAADPGVEVVVRLMPTAVVTGTEVTLADVAEIEGDSAALVSGWTIGAAPSRGDSGLVELVHIQSMLSRRGINVSRWVFRGSSRCVVRSVAKAAPQEAQPPVASRPAAAPQAKEAEQTAHAATLEAALRQHIATRLASLGGAPMVTFSPTIAKALALSRPAFEFQIVDRSERLLGMVAMDVTISENGTVRQNLPVLADVAVKKQVVVAAHPLNCGQDIAPDDLQMEERTFTRTEDIGLDKRDGLAGQRVRRFIDRKHVLFARDIEPVPLVLRNDLVTVTIRRGGLVIRGAAKAVTSGTLGEQVVLKNETSRETFAAIVTGQKTAEMKADTRTVPATLAKGGS